MLALSQLKGREVSKASGGGLHRDADRGTFGWRGASEVMVNGGRTVFGCT